MTDVEDRRHFLQLAALASLMFSGAAAADAPAPANAAGILGKASAGPGRIKIAMLVHPRMIMQDFVGPLTVFNIMRAELHLVWKNLEPVKTETGVTVAPTTLFKDCPEDLDILFAPGGLEGTIDCIKDAEVVDFFVRQGRTAKYITSDCTGSLLLGAAGLLQGYKAASHWSVIDQLSLYGAIPTQQRVVIDRNRITGGGVTAGIDFGLTLAGILRSKRQAQAIELVIEYTPEPPFNTGNPSMAPADVYEMVRKGRAPVVEEARTLGRRVGARYRA